MAVSNKPETRLVSVITSPSDSCTGRDRMEKTIKRNTLNCRMKRQLETVTEHFMAVPYSPAHVTVPKTEAALRFF
jgi:hypothetical protein